MTDETPTGDPTPTGSEPVIPPTTEDTGADLPTIPPIVAQTPTPETPTVEGPTAEAPTAAGANAWPSAAAGQDPGWTPKPAGARRVAVPLWLIIGLGGVLLLGLGFLGGWAVGSNDSSSSSASDLGQIRIAPGARIPGGNGGNGNGGGGNGGGGGFTVPQPRTQNGNGVVLGVVTEASSGDGARVVAVVPSSPAADGGLQSGDVITKVGDDDVKSPAQLATRIRSHQSGDRVTVTYTRDGGTKSATVRLTKRTSIVPRFPTGPSSNDSAPQF